MKVLRNSDGTFWYKGNNYENTYQLRKRIREERGELLNGKKF